MTRRVSSIFILALLVFALAAMTANAVKSPDELRVTNPVAVRVMDYAFPDEHNYLPSTGEGFPEQNLDRPRSVPGVTGFSMGTTWYEYQHNSGMHRQIVSDTCSDGKFIIHFEWMGLDQEALVDRHYNYAYYNGNTGAASPVLALQPSGEYAGYVSMDVTPDGRAVMFGHNNDDNTLYQIHGYWDAGCAAQTILGSSAVPEAVSDIGNACLGGDNEVVWPAMAYHEPPAGDPVTHVVGACFGGGSGESSFHYFRKVGVDFSGTWVAGIPSHLTLDSIFNGEAYDIAASKLTGKVGIIWAANLQDPNDNCNGGDTCSMLSTGDGGRDRWDNDLYAQTSDDYGVTWNKRINATRFPQGSDGFRTFADMSALISTDNVFHAAYVAMIWDDDDFGTYQSRIFHWSETFEADNPGGAFLDNNRTVSSSGQFVPENCNPGAFNQNQTKLQISECNTRLYVMWTELNSPNTNGNSFHDDCALRAFNGDFAGAANGDLFISVAGDLIGKTWDAPRGLTHTYGGPNGDETGAGACDPINGAPCPAEHWPSMTPFGIDNAVQDQGNVVTDLDVFSYDHYLDVSYILDPSPGGAITPYGTWQQADVMWLRFPCVVEVQAPQFAMNPVSTGYPSYSKHCQVLDVSLVIENPGNAPLTISYTLEEDFDPSHSGWLDYVGFPVNNTIDDGDGSIVFTTVKLNALGAGGVCNAGAGEIVELTGRINFSHNASRGSASFEIQLIVADTVVLPVFDTISTTCIDLIVSSNGNSGNAGAGEVNMDYIGSGDWKTTADTYMYDGSIIIGWDDAGTAVMHYSMFQAGFSNVVTMKPQGGQGSYVALDEFGNPWADAFYTGTYVVRDSSLAIETNWYAPITPSVGGETHCGIVIKETKIYTLDGMPRTDLVIGEAIDWDVPSDSGSDNSSEWGTDLTPPVDNAIVLRGVEYPGTNDDDEGWDADERFAATVFLRAYKYDGSGTQVLVNAEPYNMFSASNEVYVYPYDDGFSEDSLYSVHTASVSVLSDSTHNDLYAGITYLANHSLAGDDTLYLYAAHVTQMNSTFPARGSTVMSDGISDAVALFNANLRHEEGCCENPGDVNHSGGGVPTDVIDILALVSYLFQQGATPFCLDEADATGGCEGPGPDVIDLLAIVGFLFQQAGDLPECHSCGW